MEKEQIIQLVRRCQQQAPGAAQELIMATYKPVFYQCRKMLKNTQDAEDLTQEILLHIYQKLDTLQEPAAYWSWVNRMVANRCINALSRTHQDLQFTEDAEGRTILDAFEDLDEQKIPHKALDRAETAQMLDELVDALPEAQRLCVLLFYFDEMSVKEIASLLSVSENTVKSRLNYGRKAIKEGVLDYEKKGIKLYSLSPLPFLLYFLQQSAEHCADSASVRAAASKVLASASGGIPAGAAGTGAETAARTASETASATAGGSAAGTAAAHGVLKALSAKGIAAILAALLAIGGIWFGISQSRAPSGGASENTAENLEPIYAQQVELFVGTENLAPYTEYIDFSIHYDTFSDVIAYFYHSYYYTAYDVESGGQWRWTTLRTDYNLKTWVDRALELAEGDVAIFDGSGNTLAVVDAATASSMAQYTNDEGGVWTNGLFGDRNSYAKCPTPYGTLRVGRTIELDFTEPSDAFIQKHGGQQTTATTDIAVLEFMSHMLGRKLSDVEADLFLQWYKPSPGSAGLKNLIPNGSSAGKAGTYSPYSTTISEARVDGALHWPDAQWMDPTTLILS